jgi:hypothetical protein
MTAQAITGRALVVTFGGTALNGDYRELRIQRGAGAADISAGGEAHDTPMPTVGTGGASLHLLIRAGGSALWPVLAPGTFGTLTWGEEGTATGRPKHYAYGWVASSEHDAPYNNVQTLDVSFRFKTNVTDGVW